MCDILLPVPAEKDVQRERFLIIMKLGRWSVILYSKFALKMVLHMLTNMLSAKMVYYIG